MDLNQLSRSLSRHPVVRVLARVGLSVKGFVYVAIGVIALGLVLGLGGRANQAGALSGLSTTRTGLVLLWVATAGLWGMVVWQCSQSVWVVAERRLQRWFRRLVCWGKSLGYAVTSLITLAFALGYQVGEDNLVTQVAVLLVATPGGVAVLLVAGVITVVAGVAALFRGVGRRFSGEVVTPRGSRRWSRTVMVVGVVGHLAKGIAFLVAGGLVVFAALTVDPEQAAGVDGALRYLAGLPSGAVLLTVVAAGLLCNGLYLFSRAVFLPPPDVPVIV